MIDSVLSALDAEAVRATADAVLAEPLHWFPVRHHSPEVARHLRATLRERRPRVVFLEAPSDVGALLPHVVDPKTRPPVAIYSSYRDDDDVLGLAGIASPAPDVPAKFASWYPMLPYSPEYVALKECAALGARVVCIDLPYHAQLRSRAEREEHASTNTSRPSSWETVAVTSSFYRSLAEAAGYRTWDECWDALFETPGRHADATTFRREFAYFCAALRATTPRSGMVADQTLLREAHMWRTIVETLGAGTAPADAMVVCGGFHLFLARDLLPARAFPAGTTYHTLTPYSYARTSEHAGYAAGNRAPAWYERVFGHAGKEPADATVRAMVEHVVAVLGKGRREGESLSSADAIAVTQHARMLASLRGRSAPTLDDVRDALVACCCKGAMEREGLHLGRAMAATEIGNAIGRVTPALGQLPLVHDFYRQVEDLGLAETLAKDARGKHVLDLRDELHARRSVLFHRLVAVDVPYAGLAASGRENTLFREVWTLQWSPAVDAALAEKNLYGDTIEEAALARLDETLAEADKGAGVVTEILLTATRMDLPDMIRRLEESAGKAIDEDDRLTSLANALTHLVLLEGHVRRRGLTMETIAALVERCFGRACFAMPYAAHVPPEEHADVAASIRTLAEVLLGERGAHLDRAVFVENARATFRDATSAYLRGALAGVLTELRVQTTDELAAQVAAFARERPEVLVTCGDFLAGVLSTSRTALLLGADALVVAFDTLLRAAGWEEFLTLLPRARGAFAGVHERARTALADRVATHYGLDAAEGDTIAKLEIDTDAAVWLASIDARVATIMAEWEGS